MNKTYVRDKLKNKDGQQIITPTLTDMTYDLTQEKYQNDINVENMAKMDDIGARVSNHEQKFLIVEKQLFDTALGLESVIEVDDVYPSKERVYSSHKIQELVDDLAEKGTTTEVIERATKEEIEKQIQNGAIANLTIEGDSITGDKLKAKSVSTYHIHPDSLAISWEGGSGTGGDGGTTSPTTANSKLNSIVYSNVVSSGADRTHLGYYYDLSNVALKNGDVIRYKYEITFTQGGMVGVSNFATRKTTHNSPLLRDYQEDVSTDNVVTTNPTTNKTYIVEGSYVVNATTQNNFKIFPTLNGTKMNQKTYSATVNPYKLVVNGDELDKDIAGHGIIFGTGLSQRVNATLDLDIDVNTELARQQAPKMESRILNELDYYDSIKLATKDYVDSAMKTVGNGGGGEVGGSGWVSPLNGKTVNFMGDSITIGFNATKPYPTLLKELCGISVVNNYGISMSTVANATVDGYEPMCERIKNMDVKAGVITVMGGTNDHFRNVPLGTFEDRDATKFYGALRQIIEVLYTQYPNAHYMFMTPLKHDPASVWMPDGTNELGLTLTDYSNVVKEVCEHYSVPVLDLHASSNIAPTVVQSKNLYMPDGVHPNDNGHARISGQIQKALEDLLATATTTPPTVTPPTVTPPTNIPVESVVIQPSSYTFTNNSPVSVASTITPSNATNKNVRWSSNNNNIATVSTIGLVTPIANGNCVITCATEDGNKTATCNITVNMGSTPAPTIPVTSVVLDRTTHTFSSLSESTQLTATIVPANATNKSVIWESDNTNIATVSTTGLVVPKANGTCTIACRSVDGNRLATCAVIVSSGGGTTTPPTTSGELDDIIYENAIAGSTYALLLGYYYDLSNVSLKNGDVIKYKYKITYTQGDMNGVTNFTTRKTTHNIPSVEGYQDDVGNDVYIAVSPKINTPYFVEDTYTVNTLTQDYFKIYPALHGETMNYRKFNATVTPYKLMVNGTELDIDVLGHGVAYGEGTSRRDGDASEPSVSVTGVTLDKTSHGFLSFTESLQLVPTIAPVNATNKTLTWESSNTSIATVSSTGLVSPKANGMCSISVRTADGGKTAMCSVVVNVGSTPAPTVNVTSVSLDKNSYTFNSLSTTMTLTQNVVPVNATNKTVAWMSSNTGVATVLNGVVTPKANGTTVITVITADGSKTATCNVTVNTNATPTVVPVTGVTLDKASHGFDSLSRTLQLTATVLPSNATNKAVAWMSNNTSVATVSNTGLVTSKGNGACVITCVTADGSKTTTCSVVVNTSTSSQASPNYFDINHYLVEDLGVTSVIDKTNKTVTVSSDMSAGYDGYVIWDLPKLRVGRRYKFSCRTNNDKCFVRFRLNEDRDNASSSLKTVHEFEFDGADMNDNIADVIFGIRGRTDASSSKPSTMTTVFSDIKIIDLGGMPPELPVPEVTLDVVDYKIIVKKGNITESYHAASHPPKNLNGNGGIDGVVHVMKDRIKYHLTLTSGASDSQIEINGMKPFNYSYIDQGFKNTWSSRGYAVKNDTLKYTIANRNYEFASTITDDNPIHPVAFSEGLKKFNSAIPDYMVLTEDPNSVNSTSEAYFTDSFVGTCRLYSGQKFHAHQNTRLTGKHNHSSLYMFVFVHELGHSTGIWDFSPHFPTIYDYTRELYRSWFEPADIACIKDYFPHLTGGAKARTRAIPEIDEESSDVVFSFLYYKNEEEMGNASDSIIDVKYTGMEEEEHYENDLYYKVYNFEVLGVSKGGRKVGETTQIKLHKSLPLGLEVGEEGTIYISDYPDSLSTLVSDTQAVIKK